MKICYLGDANVQVRRVAEYFSAAGHEVHLITARPRPLAGFAVHSIAGILPAGRAAMVLGIPSARRLVRELRPDLIHVFYATSYGMLSSFIHGPPVALSPMGTDVLISARASRVSAAMVRRAIARASVVFSVAPHMTRRLVELGAAEGNILTFPRGVDTDMFAPAPRSMSRANPVILSNRRLEPIYNIEQLIRAAPLVLQRHPEARFVLYGEGSLRPGLEALARSAGVSEKVTFQGAIDHDRVPETLAGADIYVSCSRSDGASVSLLEAMASGLYPVVSDIEANRRWIEGRNGELVPLDDHSRMAAALVRAIEALPRCGGVLESNRKLIEREASWRLNMPRMESAYARLTRSV